MSLNRREFVVSAAGLAGFGALGPAAAAVRPLPRQEQPMPGKRPLVVASMNGRDACEKVMRLLRAGTDPLDAAVAGVTMVEDDPSDHSVGLGGLPNEEGTVQLDACVMHGPTHKGGAVAAIERIRNPAAVARLVMQRTDHVLLVGDGARRFAVAHGFKEEDLLTDEARRIWLKWKETHSDDDDWLHPEADVEAARRLREDAPGFTYGTITCLALSESGDLGGCTSTSGLSYKIPGRVGDSPILGAGLYVDNEVGACGSTGRGEANLQNCSSFLVVELMRGGASPQDACIETLRRIARKTEPRLRDADGNPAYDLNLYAVSKAGVWGGASMRKLSRFAVHDGTEARLVEMHRVFGTQ